MVPRLLNFILFPLHTAVFGPEEYGVFTYLMSFVALLNIVYSFGMETAYFRFAAKPNADQKRIFNLAQTTVVTISALFSIAFIVFNQSLSVALNVSGKNDYITWLTLIMFVDN